jgi:phage portal protein BeeE
MKVQAFLLDSASMQAVRVSSPLLIQGAAQPAEHHYLMKAVSDPASRGSRALRQKFGTQLDGVQCAGRPFDMALYAYAATINTYHSRAVRAKVKDIAGRPWRITGEGQDAAKRRLTEFFRNAFGRRSFGDGLSCVWTDYEALGNGYLEVIPDAAGQPAELAHVPATEVWVRLDGLGYVQQKGGAFAHFRAFGAPAEDFSGLKPEDPLAGETTALIHFSRYSPWSPFYGIPAIMPAWAAVVLFQLVAEYNLHFFNNNAIPDYAVILEGEVEDGAIDVIREYFKTHLKGQAHKTLCLATPGGGKIRFEKLTSDSAREGSFRLLRQDCRDEILHAHGVPPQKVGIVETGKLGGNLSTEQIEEYKNSIVTPGQEALASRLTQIIEAGFGIPGLRFEFEPFDTEDRKRNAEVDAAYLDRNVLTPNEVRSLRYPQLPPLAGGDEPLRPTTLSDLAGLEDAIGKIQAYMREAATRS